MAFSEFELARIKKHVGGLCARRVPSEIHDKLRLDYSIKRHDVEVFEVRPKWDDPSETTHTSVAKMKFVRTANEWRLFWMRRDLRWHSYEPRASSRDLADLVDEVDRDPYGCFFG